MTKINLEQAQKYVIPLAGGLVSVDKWFETAGAIAVATELVLGDQGGQTLAQAHFTSATTLKFISSNAADDAAGTGLRTVRLWGFDQDDQLMYEDITTDGDTAVTLTNTDFKTVFLMEPLTYGSSKKAVGNCHITNSAGDVYYLAIAANGFRSNYLDLYIPVGFVALFEMELWFTKATTDTDGMTFNRYLRDEESNYVQQKVQTFSFGAHKSLTTHGAKIHGIMKGGWHHLFKAVDIGSTAQTINFSIRWGLVKI
jgi:hypothetical protein